MDAVVIDIGGTTTRAALVRDDMVEKVVDSPTPTSSMLPDVSAEVLQHQLVGLIGDLIRAVSREISLPVAISVSSCVTTSAQLALDVQGYFGGAVDVRVCSDLDAARTRFAQTSAVDNFAVLMVRTAISSTHGTDVATAGSGGAGALRTIISQSLRNPKAFRSSELFRFAAQRSHTLRFEQRLALLRRVAVHEQAALIDADVWRDMHDRYAELTPGEHQRWVLPTLLDTGMFIDAVKRKDPFAFNLLDVIADPVRQHVANELDGRVEIVALAGGFARALGEPYRRRISPDGSPSLVQWAEDDDRGDLLATKDYLWPSAETIIDLRDGALSRLANAEA